MIQMLYNLKNKILYFYLLMFNVLCVCDEKIHYVSVERPAVTYHNPKYLHGVNFTTVRFGRKNPVYYVNLEYFQLDYFDNNVTVDFFFHEFLTNRYHPSFVEMHFGFCKLIHKDSFFGAAMKQGRLAEPCPYPPGEYHMYNMSISPAVIPRSFPFKKGRIYANLTVNKEDLARGYIDMEIKELKVKNKVTKL